MLSRMRAGVRRGRGSSASELSGDRQVAGLAHVLGRLTFGPFPERATTLAQRGVQPGALVDELLAAPPLPFRPTYEGDDGPLPFDIDAPGSPDPTDPVADHDRLLRLNSYRTWWVRRMLSDEAGLQDRMAWFWHTLFTTSFTKVDDVLLCWRQLRTLYEHATGNFGDLAKALTIDGAMLRYLDGNESIADAPNENYGREIMELFMLGIGHYSQADVVAAAYAFSGWRVLNPTQAVEFDPAKGPTKPVTFLGKRAVYDYEAVVDRILEQDVCAPFIVTKLWRAFVGGPVNTGAVRRWARTFRSSGYELRPVLEQMLHSPEFEGSIGARVRTPLEWYCAGVRASGDALTRDPNVDLRLLAQSPYLPPSVAGWPGDATWLSSTQMDARLRLIGTLGCPAAASLEGATESAALVDAVLRQCSIYEPSAQTRRSLTDLAASLADDPSTAPRTRAGMVLSAALLTPEFART
ncbi:MAG: DUF1800 family protein [Actinomycetes bacterium]